MTPDLLQLVELADQAGWRVVQTRRNHFAFYSPDGRTIVTIAGTPSDRRTRRNDKARLRRAGLELPNG